MIRRIPQRDTLPALPSLSEPIEERREYATHLLSHGVSIVDVAVRAGLGVCAVRTIRKKIEPPKEKLPGDSRRIKVFAATDFTARKMEIWSPNDFRAPQITSGKRFIFGKQLERPKDLAGKLPTEADIAAHIAQHGVTKCPTAAVAYTSAVIPDADRVKVAAYQQDRAEEYMAKISEYGRRGSAASAVSKRAKR